MQAVGREDSMEADTVAAALMVAGDIIDLIIVCLRRIRRGSPVYFLASPPFSNSIPSA